MGVNPICRRNRARKVIGDSKPDSNAVWSTEASPASSNSCARLNLLHAAHACGYGANWLSGWAAESREAASVLSLSEHERVAGIIHVGTATIVPEERGRPDVKRLVEYWTAG